MKKPSMLSILKYYYDLIGNKLLISLLLSISVTILDVFGIAMFLPIIGYVQGENIDLGGLNIIPQFFSHLGVKLDLNRVVIIAVLLFLLKSIISYFKDMYFIKLRFSTMKKLRFELVDQLSRFSYRGFMISNPGEIQFGMIGESIRLIASINNFIAFLQCLIVGFTYIFVALLTNFQFAILILLGVLFSSGLYNYLSKLVLKEGAELSLTGKIFNNFLIQALTNFKYLKSTNTYSIFNEQLKKSVLDYEKKNYNIGRINVISINVKEPLIVIIIVGVIYSYITFFERTNNGLLISLIIFFRALSYMMSTQSYWTTFNSSYPATIAINRLKNKFVNHEEPIQVENELEVNKIDLINVGLVFDKKEILKDINISIKDNESIALVGESGSGKTTLVNIISGLITPDKGALYVNDQNLQKNSLNSYRNRIGFVTQESVVFDDSIYNNVTLWSEKTEENISKFWECIANVNLQDFVSNLPESENSLVGSNGMLISGGQKQRLSIARELFKEIDLLILDEATSALDSETEKIIKNNLDRLKNRYKFVIVAHRLSTIKSVDKIYLLNDGEIVKEGSFQELYESSLVFKNMVDLQEI